MSPWKHKHLLGLSSLSKKEITRILDEAREFYKVLERPIPSVPALRGKTILNLFFEPSTRTLMSFTLSEKRLSADSLTFSKTSSSIKKGETLLDTVKYIEAMKIDGIVVRHSSAGVPYYLSQRINAFVINAGDGAHEHPTQALLDLFTARRHFKTLKGLKIAIIGDIKHSRVAKSNIIGFSKMGASVTVCGPPTLIPFGIEKMNAIFEYDLKKAIKDADIIYVLRIQMERQENGMFPSLREYRELFGIAQQNKKKGSIIMHPGPINRGLELTSSMADAPNSLITEQVKTGVAVRMAILYLLGGASEKI